MQTPEQRVVAAAQAARFAIVDAIGETRFAVSLSTRLYVHREAPPIEEYLVAALALLADVRDLIDQGLKPPVAAEEERDG